MQNVEWVMGEWVIPLRLLRLLEHLAVLKISSAKKAGGVGCGIVEYMFIARRTGVRNLSFLAVKFCLPCISVCLVCAPVEQNVESRAKMQFKQQ